MNTYTANTQKPEEKTHDISYNFVFAEEIQREVLENPENIMKMYERTRDILQYDFEGLYNYFIDILEKQYDYVILMSRRCLVFFQLFTYLYVYDRKAIHFTGVIMSDKAIPYYLDHFRQHDRIAIVDDIIVHGRTVYSIYTMFQEIFPDIKMDIFGYTSEEKLDCLPQELFEKLNISYIANTHEWRKLSNNIVNCILASSIPYTSFVTAFYQYNISSSWSILEKNENIVITRNTKDIQSHAGISSYCIYEKIWNKPDLFSSLSLGECIRLYWNEFTKKLTVIPYVFIRSLSAEHAEMTMDYVCDFLPEEYSNIKLFLHKKSQAPNYKKALEEYKMRILTCFLSSYYWKSFAERHSLPEPQYVDVDTLTKSFGDPVAVELGKIKTPLLNITKSTHSVCINKKADNTAGPDITKAEKEFDGWLSTCLYDAWVTDEIRAEKNKSRARGYKIDYLLQQGMATGLDSYTVLSKLLNSWDTGIAAANFSFNSDTNDIGCYVVSGEQSYKILLENNANIMYALITVSNMVTKSDAEKHSSHYEDYRVQLLKKLLEKFNSDGQLQDYSKLEALIENTKGYLNAWDQPVVWTSDMSEENKKIMSDFIKENF